MADSSVVFKVTADDAEAQKKLDALRRDIQKTEKAINTTSTKKSGISEKLEQARKEAEATRKEIEAINAQKLENESVLSGKTGDIDLEEFNARDQALKENNYELKEQQKTLAAQEATITNLKDKEQELTAQLEKQTAQLEQQKMEAGEVERAIASQATSAMPQLAAATEAVSTAMRKGFKNILKWGFGIRSAFILIRRLRSAVIEGVKAFAAQDQETQTNINNLKSALATLKMSWGAAFAPIFNAVVPFLQKLISWLTAAANAIAMFFSALTGKSSYKKAIAGNNALAESYGGAGAAAEEAEGQIMGFDEINKLNDNSDSGGGGGGGGAGDIAQQFEEIPILESFKKHLDDILIVVGLIGAALLAWKLAPMLGTSFQKVFGILVAIIGLVEMVRAGMDAWNNGVNWENLFDMLKGAALLVGGLALAFGTTGAAIGLLVAGIWLLVVGLHDWITTGELSTQTFTMLEIGILAVGGAIALLTGLWIPLVIAAVVGLALAIYKYWDEIKAKWNELWSSIKSSWDTFKQSLINAFKEFGTAAKQSFIDTWNNIKRAASDAWENIKTTVKNGVDKIKSFMHFEWHLPHLPLPHIQVSWTDTSNSSIAKLLGITAIPNFSLQWYAKGGIVDGATLFGAGEAGREAVVPLERHTEWISMVADGIIDRITSNNRLADYISGLPMPALVSGGVVPPRALSGGGSVFSDGDIERLVSGISAALNAGGGSGDNIIRLYLDGRQIAETVTKHQGQMNRGRGR